MDPTDNNYETTYSEDLSLPKATVIKLISTYLPSDMTCSKEARGFLIDCCVEFIHLISTKANDICEEEKKKTISPDQVISALVKLGYNNYVEQVSSALTHHRKMQKEREKKVFKLDKSGLSEEDLLHEQEKLFENARQKYFAHCNIDN